MLPCWRDATASDVPLMVDRNGNLRGDRSGRLRSRPPCPSGPFVRGTVARPLPEPSTSLSVCRRRRTFRARSLIRTAERATLFHAVCRPDPLRPAGGGSGG